MQEKDQIIVRTGIGPGDKTGFKPAEIQNIIKGMAMVLLMFCIAGEILTMLCIIVDGEFMTVLLESMILHMAGMNGLAVFDLDVVMMRDGVMPDDYHHQNSKQIRYQDICLQLMPNILLIAI